MLHRQSFEVLHRQSFDRSAGEIVTASKAQEITRIADGKAEIVRASLSRPGAADAPRLRCGTALTARWRRHQANALVVADGLDVDSDLTGQSSDRLADLCSVLVGGRC